MSWSNYLVDKTEKVIIPIGKVDEYEFNELAKKWENFLNYHEENDELIWCSLEEKRLKDFTTGDLDRLIKFYKLLPYNSNVRLEAIFYYIRCHKYDKIIFIGEGKIEKYKGYKILN
ncbi:MAG: hypothetical protein ACTSQG_06315 [Promethearchaeota archaeon]